PVGEAHRRGAADRRDVRSAPEEDAHLRLSDAAEPGARVVVRQDPVVLPAVERVAVSAPLTHADAVAPAVTGDDQRGPRARGGGGAGSDDRRDQHDRDPEPHPQTAVPPLLCVKRGSLEPPAPTRAGLLAGWSLDSADAQTARGEPWGDCAARL